MQRVSRALLFWFRYETGKGAIPRSSRNAFSSHAIAVRYAQYAIWVFVADCFLTRRMDQWPLAFDEERTDETKHFVPFAFMLDAICVGRGL